MSELGTRNDAFLEAIDVFLRGMDGEPSSGMWECPECGHRWDVTEDCPECGCDLEIALEPSFSWSGCDCCDSTLGGDLYPMIGWLNGAREAGFNYETHGWEGRACADCVIFFANGDLPEQ